MVRRARMGGVWVLMDLQTGRLLGLETRSKAEPRQQQDWILKCLQGG
jgi:hypothetical protein